MCVPKCMNAWNNAIEQYICVFIEITSYLDARLARSFPLLIFLGAERQQKLRFSGKFQEYIGLQLYT